MHSNCLCTKGGGGPRYCEYQIYELVPDGQVGVENACRPRWSLARYNPTQIPSSRPSLNGLVQERIPVLEVHSED